MRRPKSGSKGAGRPPSAPARSRRRWLLPREHGAYAEIGFPLLTVLLLGTPGLGALMLTIAIAGVFLLHEPIVVLLGHRGTRLKREAGGAAVRSASVFAASGVSFGIAGLWLSPPAAQWGALVPLVLGAALLPITATRREKTLFGELLAAVALVTASVPVALAASLPIAAVLVVNVVWGVSFALGTLAVRATVVGAKGGAEGRRLTVLLLAIGATLVALWAAANPELATGRAALAVMPGAAAAIGLVVLPIPPRRIRIIGWTIAGSNVITLSLFCALLSSSQ